MRRIRLFRLVFRAFDSGRDAFNLVQGQTPFLLDRGIFGLLADDLLQIRHHEQMELVEF